jgi:hypothetical protein
VPINNHPTNPWHTMDKISGGKAYTCMRMSTQRTLGGKGCRHGAPGPATRQAAGNNAVASWLQPLCPRARALPAALGLALGPSCWL